MTEQRQHSSSEYDSHQPNKQNMERDADDSELDTALTDIWEIALDNHMDPFDTQFHIAPASVVYRVGATGIPGRFNHWTFGREYNKMMTEYNHGLSKIYELVINSEPSIAFLLENNPPVYNKFIMAHVLGHTDFFKNNYQFGPTRRDMPAVVAGSASRIKDYESTEGALVVEQFIDATLSIEAHVDPFNRNRPGRTDELRLWKEQAKEQRSPERTYIGEFDDLWGARADTTEQDLGRKAIMQIPPEPDHDLLGFIRNHAPYLEDWQRDIVDIVRSEAMYFHPQRRTKIMNEGWAAYWHKRIMREMSEKGKLTGAENEDWWMLHSQVVAPNPKQLNPYYLGMKMYEYIEDYYNGHLTDEETAHLESKGVETYPSYEGPLKDSPAMSHLRDIMMRNDDQSFMRNYFNKIIADRMHMYIFDEIETYPGGETIKVIRENGWEQVRDYLVNMLDNSGVPSIVVVNGDHNNTGGLHLRHEYDGRMLDPVYINKTLPYIYALWQRPVQLDTVDSKTGKNIHYTHDGQKTTLKMSEPKK